MEIIHFDQAHLLLEWKKTVSFTWFSSGTQNKRSVFEFQIFCRKNNLFHGFFNLCFGPRIHLVLPSATQWEKSSKNTTFEKKNEVFCIQGLNSLNVKFRTCSSKPETFIRAIIRLSVEVLIVLWLFSGPKSIFSSYSNFVIFNWICVFMEPKST